MVLPAYENLLIFMSVLLGFVALGDVMMIIRIGKRPKDRDVFLTIQLSALCLLAIYSLVPVLLLQRSIAYKSYLKVLGIIGERGCLLALA